MWEDPHSSKSTSDQTSCMASSSGGSSYKSHPFLNPEDRKWANYLKDDAGKEKSKKGIKTRIQVMEDSQENMRKKAYEKGITTWKTTKIPNVEGQTFIENVPDTIEKSEKLKKDELEVKAMECLEGLEKSENIENTPSESKKRKDVPEHEEEVKKLREQLPLQYFWKPDPLFYLHLTQLGYSRIAVEKALYHTDNKSVDLAEKYIQEHPDLTPLTKDEVLADAEAFLKDTRPLNLEDKDCSGNERKKDGSDQKLQFDSEKSNSQENKWEPSEGQKEGLSPHLEEKVKINEETESPEEKVELLCVINSDTALNMATLATECSRATVKIMEELQKDEWSKLHEGWTKYGKCVNAYKTDGELNLHQLWEKLLVNGHLGYLADVQNPLSPDSSSPAVLCILTSEQNVRKIHPGLYKIN